MNLNELRRVKTRPPFLEIEVLSITVDEDEKPLLVRIERPDVEAMAEEMKALPGDRPDEPRKEGAEISDAQAEDLARRLIARFAAVQGEDGAWVRPAFTFASPPDPDLIDGAQIADHELRMLALAVMYLGGYLRRGPGEAAPATFLGERGGSGSGS